MKKGVLKNFTIFTGKHLCQIKNLICQSKLNKIIVSRPVIGRYPHKTITFAKHFFIDLSQISSFLE